METNVGIVRSHNEDRVRFVLQADRPGEPDRDSFLLVADGMGGHAAGDFASALAEEVVRRIFYDLQGPIRDRLQTAFAAANKTIFEDAKAHPERAGMGTTCTALGVRDGVAWFAHVGDSRAYLLRAGGLTQLTEDQTLVRKLVKDGAMTEDEARVSENSNVLLQAMGTAPAIVPELSEGIVLALGDVLILCTDGLHGLVRDDKIAEIAAQHAPHEACQKLVRAALLAGGHDNVSVGVFRVLDAAAEREPAPAPAGLTRPIAAQETATRQIPAFERPL